MTVPGCLNAVLLTALKKIEFVGSQTGGFGGTLSTTTVTFNLTGGSSSVPAAADLVIVSYTINDDEDYVMTINNTVSVAYVLLGTELYANDSNGTNLRVAYRFMPATPETAVVLSGSEDVAAGASYTIFVFRNVASVVVDVTTTTATGLNSYLVNPPAITPVTSGAWVYVSGAGAAATAGTYSSTDLTAFISTATADTRDSCVGTGYKVWTSGAFDPVAWTNSIADSVNNSWASVTVALRPE